MFKNILIITLYVISLTSCSIFQSEQKVQKEKLAVPYTNFITIQVEINGHNSVFIWDTGCWNTTINTNRAKELDIKLSDDIGVSRILQIKKEAKFKISKPTPIKVNNREVKVKLCVGDSYKNIFPDQIAGVIGQDVISQFYWDFDFMTNEFSASTAPFDIVEELALVLASGVGMGLPFVTVSINNFINHNMFLDTGMEGVEVTYKNESLNFDIAFVKDTLSSAIWKYLFNKHPTSVSIEAEGSPNKGKVLDSMCINNFSLGKAYVRLLSEPYFMEFNDRTYISMNFIRRFSRMYYNPFDNTIKLYINPQDTTRYTGAEIDEFFANLK